jgi:hypothetical protein
MSTTFWLVVIIALLYLGWKGGLSYDHHRD